MKGKKGERESKREGGKILLSEMACHLRTPDPEHLKGLKQGVWGGWRAGGERQSKSGELAGTPLRRQAKG